MSTVHTDTPTALPAALLTVTEDRSEFHVKWTVRHGRRVVSRVVNNTEVLALTITQWAGPGSGPVTYVWRPSDRGRTVPRLVSVALSAASA